MWVRFVDSYGMEAWENLGPDKLPRSVDMAEPLKFSAVFTAEDPVSVVDEIFKVRRFHLRYVRWGGATSYEYYEDMSYDAKTTCSIKSYRERELGLQNLNTAKKHLDNTDEAHRLWILELGTDTRKRKKFEEEERKKQWLRSRKLGRL